MKLPNLDFKLPSFSLSQLKSLSSLQLFSGVRFLDVRLFTKHMSIMAKSSITITEAIDILASQSESKAFKKVLYDIGLDIKNGESLSEAMGKYPKIFNAFYTNIIEIGETSGTLDQSFSYLSTQLAKDYAFRKKVQSALMYPTIVLIAASAVSIGVSLFVLPKLVDLFNGFDTKLPLSTQLLIGFSTIMQKFGILVVLGFVGLLILGKFLLSQSKVKPYVDKTLFYMPVFGKLLQDAEITGFCRNLGIMLKSGIPIMAALDIQVKITTNTVFKKYMQDLLDATLKGSSFSGELERGKYKQIPLIVTKMISVGEQTGRLDETLVYLGDFFEDEVDDIMRNISTLLEPIMLLFIGSIVAFVALAIISPIYQLTGSAGQ